MNNSHEAFEALYRSEINFGMQSAWDGGVDVWLGGGYGEESVLEKTNFPDGMIEPIAAWLIRAALKHFPDSEFAKSGLVTNIKPLE